MGLDRNRGPRPARNTGSPCRLRLSPLPRHLRARIEGDLPMTGREFSALVATPATAAIRIASHQTRHYAADCQSPRRHSLCSGPAACAAHCSFSRSSYSPLRLQLWPCTGTNSAKMFAGLPPAGLHSRPAENPLTGSRRRDTHSSSSLATPPPLTPSRRPLPVHLRLTRIQVPVVPQIRPR